MALHSAQQPGEIHGIINWLVANATARLSLVLAATDIGRVAKQTDTQECWVLINNTGPVWKNITSDRNISTTVAAVAGVLTLDLSLGDYFKTTLAANVTSLVLSNPPATPGAKSFWLEINQDPATARTFTMPSSFKWEGGVVGVISIALSSRDILAGTTIDAGTKWDVTLSKGRA